MNLALRQLPDEPAVDGAEGEFPGLGQASGAGDVIQNPRDLTSRKKGIDQQTGALLDHGSVTILPELFAKIGGAAVLPDDRVVNGFAGFAIPDDRGLTLVDDANGCNTGRARSGFGKSLGCDRDLRRNDLFRIMLNPAGTGKDLIELLLRDRADGTFFIEQKCS